MKWTDLREIWWVKLIGFDDYFHSFAYSRLFVLLFLVPYNTN